MLVFWPNIEEEGRIQSGGWWDRCILGMNRAHFASSKGRAHPSCWDEAMEVALAQWWLLLSTGQGGKEWMLPWSSDPQDPERDDGMPERLVLRRASTSSSEVDIVTIAGTKAGVAVSCSDLQELHDCQVAHAVLRGAQTAEQTDLTYITPSSR
jgi:hypothetical protein